jgi:hypothetical protein
MAVDHEKIRRLLGEKEESTDHGLGAKSLRRALSGDVPKTLTPYEWEQWYADHGVPEGHLASEEEQQTTSTLGKTPTYATWLGRAGLLPFVGLLLALYIDTQNQPLWANTLATYTLAIICFLVGAWWGMAVIQRSPITLLLSNGIVLAAFFGQLLLSTAGFFLLGAFLFIATVIVERRHGLFKPQPLYYARLRLQLTLVASISLVLAAMLL